MNKGDNDFADFKPSPTSKTEKVKDKEMVDREEQKGHKERKHSKDRHRDHKKHKHKDRSREDKDRHRQDRDKHRENRDRYRKRDDMDKDERKRREYRDREHRSGRREDNCSEDSSKGEGSSDSTYDSSGNQTCHNLPTTNAPIPALPLVSPSRRNPKPRLSLEEKIFQRELEVALEISKEEPSQAPPNVFEPEEHKVVERGTVVEERQDSHPLSSPKPLPEQSAEGGCSALNGRTGLLTEPSSLAHEKPSIVMCEEEEAAEHTPDPTPPPAVADCAVTMQPLPSTSAGKTAKRIRKTVMFKEDSDSDDFDGFGCDDDAESDASEGSDFMPSPKKKKKAKESKKTKNTKTSRNSAPKSSSKSTGQNKGDMAASPRNCPLIAKENTAPKDTATPLPKSELATPKVTTSTELKASSSLHTPPPTKSATKKASVAKPVKRSLISSSSSPSSGGPSISLVKTPFRSPLSTSLNSGYPTGSPSISMGTKNLNRGTGLRLGLSRRAHVKPLHPSAASRITD
ncbi:flocculation protein FLO11-like isoform X2 [Portunus trituberculatus]|uniref:flocculation protein FLO11-like isoform X2 n=1 Tax=Portunus trituberculatus TaxID=210409 RepID=UPI001E1D1357|nr:flocculation protein FLO11-like isoform X2 [Portunus trituberculatus]